MNKLKATSCNFIYVCIASLLLLILTSCGSSTSITITDLGPVEPSGKVEIKKGIGIAVKVENPDNLPVTYKWTATRGEVRPSTSTVPAGTYDASDTTGMETITVQVIYEDKILAEESMQIEVVPASATPTATPTASLPMDTPVLPTPTKAIPTDTPTPAGPTSTPGPITLTSIKDEQIVPCENLAKGTYIPDIEGKAYIWPVVFIGTFHPQDTGGKAAPMRNGAWYATVRFGNCTEPPAVDSGKPFELLIVAANEEANKEFEEYIATGAATGKWTGMARLPDGATVSESIVVTRQ